MSRISWEEKLEILTQICPDLTLRMRKPGDWYLNAPSRYIVGDGLQRGEYGSGRNPKEAVEDDFDIMCNLPKDRYVCMDKYPNKKYYKLHKSFWKEYSEHTVYPGIIRK